MTVGVNPCFCGSRERRLSLNRVGTGCDGTSGAIATRVSCCGPMAKRLVLSMCDSGGLLDCSQVCSTRSVPRVGLPSTSVDYVHLV